MNESFSYLRPDTARKLSPTKEEDIVYYQNGKKKRKVYQNCEYDQLQQKQIKEFRNYAKNIYDVRNVPDYTIMRYLYSYDFKHQETLEKLRIYIDWYTDPKIQRMDSKVLEIINMGFCYTYGRDKAYQPIIYLNVALIDLDKYCIDDYLAAINAVITLVVDKLFIKGKLQNYLLIIDTENKNFTSLPLNKLREMIIKLSYVYSMRMGKLLIINCNYIIKLIYSGISNFLADVTKEKTNLLSYSEVQQGKLKEYIDINELQQKYGGFRENLIQKWPPQLPGMETKKKTKKLQEFSFSLEEQIQIQTEYFSVQNDSQIFYKIEDKTIATQGCCSNQKCEIY